MKKLIQNVRNLFKIYDLMSRESLTFDLKAMGAEEGYWYCLTAVMKRENNSVVVNELSLFQTKTEKQAKDKGQKLNAYYKTRV